MKNRIGTALLILVLILVLAACSGGGGGGSTTTTPSGPGVLVSMTVTPANPSIAKGTSEQFSALGIFSDNTIKDLTGQVTWTSSATSKASINSNGVASGLAAGTTTITATSGSTTATATLSVTNATLLSLSVTPVNPSAVAGSTQQFTAMGTFSDGTAQDLSTQVVWTSSATSVATINANGLASAVAAGTATITAKSSSITSNAGLTVTAAPTAPTGSVQLSGTIQPDPGDPTATSSNSSGATVYAQGQQNTGTTSDSNGNFTLSINPTLSGTVLASAKLKKAGAVSKVATGTQTLVYTIIVVDSNDSHGRAVDVTIVTNQTNSAPTIYVNTVGKISGHAYLQGASDHSGITVYVPGTSFSAITAADGSYTISGVPSGSYNFLRAEKFGTTYHYAIQSDVSVNSGQTTNVSDMTLQLSTGPFGGIMINDGDVFTSSATVTLSIAPSADAVLMSISDHSDFVGSAWQPVQATIPFTFTAPYPAGGQVVNAYVKFAQESGLASDPTMTSIYLDTNPQAVSPIPPHSTMTMSTTPTLQWQYTAPMPSPRYHVQLANDPGFTNLIVDQNNLSVTQYTVGTTLSNLAQYYWRVAIIYNGTQLNWGPTWAFAVNRNAGTLQSPANGTLTNNASPQFSWLQNPSASSYSFVLSTNSNLSSPIITASNIVGGSYGPIFSLPTATSTIYYWAVTPYDSLGNPGIQSTPWNFTLDTVSPTPGNFWINNSGDIFTGRRNVTLNLSATDAHGVASYFASDSSSPSSASDPGWQPMTSSPTLTLSSSTGPHSVNVWFKDTVGNYLASQTSSSIGLINFTDNILTLDSGGIRYPSIAVCAPYGHAFVDYMDTLNAWVKYTTNAGGSWAPPIYVDQNNVSIPGTNHSIACTSEYSGIHAALRDGNTGATNLVYAFRGYQNGWPLDWSAVSKDASGGINWTASIAVDASNNAYISYDHNGNLYFTSNVTSWGLQAVDATGTSMFNSSIVTDSTGTVHIVYHDHASWTLKYAYAPGPLYNSWTLATIDSAASTSLGMSASLAIDSNNNLHVAYMDYTNHALKYATKANGSSTWTKTTVDSTLSQYDIDYSFQNVSIAVAAPNKVFISYGTQNGLKLATNYFTFSGAWPTSFVDTSSSVGDTSIAVDSGSKTIHIVYTGGQSLLKYTKGQYW